MTGVVEAGFVLAAFPLVISALEHYRDGARIAGGWWTIRRDYTRYKQTMEVQHQMFRDNLEELLAPVVNDEDQLNLLLNDPGGTKWADPTLEQRLHHRLPRSYKLYADLIRGMTKVMEEVTGISRVELQEKAKAEPADGPLRSSWSKWTSRAKLGSQGIKFAWKETLREEHLSRISQYNSDLRELRASSDRLAESRRVRAAKSKIGRTFTAFWRHANNLYAVLMDAWQCDCQHFHHANLLLLHRTSHQVNFKIMFVFAQNATIQKPRPWTWQEANIVILQDAEKTKTTGSATPIQTPTLTTISGTPSKSAPQPSRNGKKSVAFIEVTSLPTPPSDHHSVSPEITNLCSTIASLDPDSSCLGFLKSKDHRYSVYPLLKQQANNDSREFLNLEYLISKSCNITLTRRQRYFMALTLASSHLQLYYTPWLSTQWNKRDILFLRGDNASVVHLDQPYISRKFHPLPPSYTATTSPSTSKDRGTSTLGIILLELCFGTALEDHPIWQRNNPVGVQRNPTLDLVAAIDWCDISANDEGGPEFADAIGWCLKSATCKKKPGVEDAAWREEFFVNVMEPLQNCCEILTGGPVWS